VVGAVFAKKKVLSLRVSCSQQYGHLPRHTRSLDGKMGGDMGRKRDNSQGGREQEVWCSIVPISLPSMGGE